MSDTPESRPLTRQECEEATSKAIGMMRLLAAATASPSHQFHLIGRQAEQWVEPMAALIEAQKEEIGRLRELLERAPEPCTTKTYYGTDHCFLGAMGNCPACTWNAERKRATEGWEGK